MFENFKPDIAGLQILRLRTQAILVLMAGAVMTLALPPFGLWPFLFIGLASFYLLLSRWENWKRSFILGWCFGFGYFAAGLWWIANALLVEGNPYSWVWPLAIAGLPALLSFFVAIACALTVRLFPPAGLSRFLGFVTILSLSEWLRGHVFTGFPWNLFGYAWSGWPAMMQSASLGGAYFLSLLTIFWAAVPGLLCSLPLRSGTGLVVMAATLASIAGNIFFGYARLASIPVEFHKNIAVRAVQPGTLQEDKWDPAKTWENFEALLSQSRPLPGQNPEETVFLVWPETAISQRLLQYEEVRRALRDTLESYPGDVFLVTGWLRRDINEEGQEQFYNSLAVFSRDLKLVATYDKFHLVPFGEYIPLQRILPLAPFVQLDGFTPGPGPASIATGGLPAFSPLICYEIIFPRAVTPDGAGIRPAWIVNVTNDAWYGNSPGPYQHFAQARFRAVEEGLPVVRAANTGISGVVDPLGNVVYATHLFEKRGENTGLPKPIKKPTLYSRVGDLAYFILLFGFALSACIFRTREKP